MQQNNMGRPANRKRPKGCTVALWDPNLRRVKNYIFGEVTVAPFELTPAQLWALEAYEKASDKKKFILDIFK